MQICEAWVDDPLWWRQRAAELSGVLRRCSDADVRLAILRSFIYGLGDNAYPGFLKLLLIIADSDEASAKRCLADTYAHALARMDVPGGVLSAWGASAIKPGQRVTAASLASPLTTRRRNLGPVEYLSLWFGQKTQRPYLSASTYRDALRSLLELLNTAPNMTLLYPAKILADLHAASDGSYTRQTRARLAALATGWQQGASPASLADAASSDFIHAMSASPSTWLRKDL